MSVSVSVGVIVVAWRGGLWHGVVGWEAVERSVTMSGAAWHGMSWHVMAWHGMAWHNVTWCGVVVRLQPDDSIPLTR